MPCHAMNVPPTVPKHFNFFQFPSEAEEDLNVMQSLKETVAKQRGQIKGLQSDVKQKDIDLETVCAVF